MGDESCAPASGLTGGPISRTIGAAPVVSMEVVMADLTRDDIRSMGKAVGLEIEEPELTEVMYSLNALLEALDGINPPGLESVEPLPIILPPA